MYTRTFVTPAYSNDLVLFLALHKDASLVMEKSKDRVGALTYKQTKLIIMHRDTILDLKIIKVLTD